MLRGIKKGLSFFICLAVLLSVGATIPAKALTAETVKNVIILIPDGMSLDGTTLARWYKGGQPLAMDEMASGLVRTYSSDAPIADSAPAGTAFATGYKSHTGYIGVLPDVASMPGLTPIKKGDEKKPVATILEGAKLAGKATGIISTSEVMHATPAAFTSHYPSRKNYDALSEQQVYNGIDVVLGAGSKFLSSEYRKDKEDLNTEVKNLGYDYVTNTAALKSSTSNKIWGMFSETSLAYDMDRDPAKEPSLAEMTKKAIDTLSKDEDGFFLMVEGSKIDWAAHANDPIGLISDIIAFDDAVKVALNFAKADGDTVLIVASDHVNGGISMGDSNTTSSYDKEPLSTFVDPLRKAKITGEGIESKLNSDKSNIMEVMATYFGIADLTEEEIRAIKDAKAGRLNSTIGPLISKRASIGWTTGGHTGEEVVLYSYSPGSIKQLRGTVENTYIAEYMAEVLGINLEEVNKKLFVPARAAFEAKGAELLWDDKDPNNPVVIVTKGSNVLKLPVYKNTAELNDKVIKINGLTIHNGVKTFVPQEAIDLIK